VLIQIIKAHNAKMKAVDLSRKAVGAKRKRCTGIADVAVVGAAGDDTRAAEIRATSATALDAEVVQILARALGQRRIDVSDLTYLDGPEPIADWKDGMAYVLPSYFSLAALLIKINTYLQSQAIAVDEVDAEGNITPVYVIPEKFDAAVTAVIPFVLYTMGPPQRPGQIYTARSPWAEADPMNKSNYILCTRAVRDGETVYNFHADNSLFKRENWVRHKAQYSGYFNILLYHYFYRVYKRNSLKTAAIPGLDPRLCRYACTDPSFKPYRVIGKDGTVTHRSDASRVLLSAFRAEVDKLLGKGTSQAHQIDKLPSVYSARVLTYAKNFTPGSLQYLQDLAFIKGVMNKNDYAKNRAELAECAKIQEAIGLSGCQSEYDYRNGSNHVDHACNLFYVFKTVELMIKEDPDGHLLKMENLRHHRQEHFECVPLFQSGQVPPPNIDIPSPLQTSPNVLTPPAYDRVVPIIEELD
jgi:hypothetical protein